MHDPVLGMIIFLISAYFKVVMFLLSPIVLLVFIGGLAAIKIYVKTGRIKYYISWLLIWCLSFLAIIAPGIIPTNDSGKACFDSGECEGYCTFIEMPKEWNENSTEKVQGNCSPKRRSSGCYNIIENGVPIGICID
jgi:hypothetical protein